MKWHRLVSDYHEWCLQHGWRKKPRECQSTPVLKFRDRSVLFWVLCSRVVSAAWMKEEVQRIPNADWSWTSETDLFWLGSFVYRDTRDIYIIDKRSGPENTKCWLVLNFWDRSVLFGSSCREWCLQHGWRKGSRAYWSWISEIGLFVLVPLVTSGVSTSWMKEEVQRIPNADWSWLSKTDLFCLGSFVYSDTCDRYLQHGWRKRSREYQLLTGLELLRPICFVWSLVSRVISTVWMQEEVQSRLALNFWDRSVLFGSFCI